MNSQTPFLKWPGGKRWLTPFLLEMLAGRKVKTYFEPFLGGGALFFALRPKCAYLSDINQNLINTYLQVRDNHRLLISGLRQLPVTKRDYYRIRGRRRHSAIHRAIDFLYLNRTAFAGIYRLNRDGEFNVPYGGGKRTPSQLYETEMLVRAANTLANTTLTACDFEAAMSRAVRGDVIYCDPTYTVTHDNNGFVRYNERNFSWSDQRRLASVARAAAASGVLVIVSNAHHADVAALYADALTYVVRRRSLLAPSPNHRREILESVFVYLPT
jgi:DNA adenine methylase